MCSGADDFDKVHGTTDRSRQLLRHLVGSAGNTVAGRKHTVPETMCYNVDVLRHVVGWRTWQCWCNPGYLSLISV